MYPSVYSEFKWFELSGTFESLSERNLHQGRQIIVFVVK